MNPSPAHRTLSRAQRAGCSLGLSSSLRIARDGLGPPSGKPPLTRLVRPCVAAQTHAAPQSLDQPLPGPAGEGRASSPRFPASGDPGIWMFGMPGPMCSPRGSTRLTTRRITSIGARLSSGRSCQDR
jgi:hypothetical protein